MENWYNIVEPHQDIKNKEFSMDVFAADLGDVVAGNAPIDYQDPDTFVRKTYFTSGLMKVLRRVRRKLVEGKGDPIVELQTPFGGGKTHALLTIYHYVRNGEKVESLFPEDIDIIDAKTTVLPCDHLDPQGREEDGLEIKTLWGELAYRMGGEEGYEEFRDSDENAVAPGQDKLINFLEKHQPFALLMDEVLEYIAGALGVEYAKTNLGSQTFKFLTSLTKAMGSIENGMLVVTLPSSELEDFTPKEEQGLAKLNKIFGRVEAIETPVKGKEIYSIIRRRLFQETKKEDKKNEIIHRYFELYRNNKEDVPKEVKEEEFKEKLNKSYPFHPRTIDILDERWGTFSNFQRTRGVLRLLALVVSDLYESEKNIDLMLPSDLNLNNPGIRREFLKCIGDEYESIISSDIAGENAKAQALDNANKNWNHLAERISTTIFLYSFTAGEGKKGVELPSVKLTTMRPNTMLPLITEIKEKLDNELWYIKEEADRYYFSTIPNLKKMVRDKRELFDPDDVEEEIRTIIKKEIGKEFDSYLWPESSRDIPDNRKIKLVVTHPDFDEDETEEWADKRKEDFRTYKNTLIFTLADAAGLGNLKASIRDYLALQEIKEDVELGENEAMEERLPKIKEQIKKLKNDFSYDARNMYKILRVGDKKIDLGMPSVGKESLSSWYKRELEDREELIQNLHYRPIISDFLSDKDKIKSSKIMEQFYKDKNRSMLQDQDVLKTALKKGVEDGKLGIAEIEDEEMIPRSFRFNETIGTDDVRLSENEFILSGSHCEEITCSECGTLLKDGECPKCSKEPQPTTMEKTEVPKIKGETLAEAKEKLKSSNLVLGNVNYEQSDTSEGTVIDQTPESGETIETGEEIGLTIAEGEKTQKYQKIRLKIGDLPSSKIADFNRGVLMPITRDVGEIKLNIEIDVEDEEGIKESVYRDEIKQTLKQIGAEIVEENNE